MPVDKHPQHKKSALELIFSTLHAGGKFDGENYKTAGGLHGVGSSVVNALSELMEVEVARDRVLWKQDFARGLPVTKLRNAGPVHNRRGTSIRFRPDSTVFANPRFQPAALASRLLMKPSTSVLVERSVVPSSHSVLAAPTFSARSSAFDSARAASLFSPIHKRKLKYPVRGVLLFDLGNAKLLQQRRGRVG